MANARVQYQEKLDELRNDVVRMGNDAIQMVRIAVDGALEGDRALAESVMAADDAIDSQETTIFTKTVLIVLQESPVASDLRMLVSTMGTVGEIEKAADDAVKLARRSTKLAQGFPSEMKRALMEMGEQARRQFSLALRLYADYDADLADEIIQGDKKVDSAYKKARNAVYELIKDAPENTDSLVRTIEVFHALEHVADHAVEIARRMRILYEI